VARSSRTGTKRSVKAGPTSRLPAAAANGIAPATRWWSCKLRWRWFFSSARAS
jgi:hypothetical protein